MSKVMTAFDPKKHGFHFSNSFVNVVIPQLTGSIVTKGRCGGMAFAALDYYYAKLPVPTHRGSNSSTKRESDFGNGEIPPDGTRLADYIYRRLFDSFLLNGIKFLSWTQKLDHFTLVYGNGVTKLTKEEEFPKLIQQLANGPVALGLIKAEHIKDIGKNHQVVAYGAELDKASGTMTVYIYDNNAPDQTVTLTSDPSDPHFISSLTDANSNHFCYRGWFVEDYSAMQPTYIDLAVVKALSINDPNPKLGDPLDCTYTVKNFGDFPSNILALNVDVAVPAGEAPSAKFVPDTTKTTTFIQPQHEHVFSGHCDCFAGTKGRYTLQITCTQQPGVTIDLPTAFVFGPGTTFTPTQQLSVDVQYLSARIVAPPPCVESVEAIFVTDGAKDPLKPCEQPRVKYRASWVHSGADYTRKLEVFSEPIIPVLNKTLLFNVKFSTSGAMKKETVKLRLAGRASDGTNVNISVPLTGSKDFFTGTWKPQHRGNAAYKLTLSIEGEDDLPRYPRHLRLTRPGTVPDSQGEVLDSLPQTVATVDTTRARYPFKNYEPGADSNYIIELAPKQTATIATDTLELNDSFSTAFEVVLTGATVEKGAWKHFDSLNFHSATDQDFFSIQYESLPGDAACLLKKPTKVLVSAYLGLYVSHYPPCLCISINANGMCTDLDLYKTISHKPQLYKSHAKEFSLSLFNPTKVFTNKTLYAVIKNSNFTYQGAFPYGVEFGYVPAHSVLLVDTNAPAYSARPDIRHNLLKRYYDMIDLPRPGDDLLNKAADSSFPYPANSLIITDTKKSVTEQQAFLTHPDTISDIKTIAPEQGQAALASALTNLGKMAQKAKFDKEAEGLYRASAVTFAVANLTDSQIEVLQMLAIFYDTHRMFKKSAGVKKKISKIRLRSN